MLSRRVCEKGEKKKASAQRSLKLKKGAQEQKKAQDSSQMPVKKKKCFFGLYCA